MSIERKKGPDRRTVLKAAAAVGLTALAGDSEHLEKKRKPVDVKSKDMKGMERGREKRTASFDEQFANREMIETAGGTAEVIDVTPENLKDDIPVLFAPAWACTLPIYEPAIKTLTGEGRRTLSLNHPRYGGEMDLTEEENELVKEYPTEEVRKALTLRDILNQKSIEKVDVIAHSEGAINAAIAALLHPEKFRNIVFFGPAGLIGDDNAKRLLQGFAHQGDAKPSLDEIAPSLEVSEEEKVRTDTVGSVPIRYPKISVGEDVKEAMSAVPMELAKYTLGNPVRSVKEGYGMSQAHIEGLIAKLRERGIGIVVMSAVDDPVFPTERMATLLKKGSVDGFLSVRGGHGQIGENPERYMVAANQMLENLRDRKK